MLYDGIKFRRNRNIVVMRVGDDKGTGNAVFGRWYPTQVPNSVRTSLTFENGDPVYAVEIPIEGRSLTNMVRTKKQYILAKDGMVFTAPVTPTHYGHPYNRRTGEYLT